MEGSGNAGLIVDMAKAGDGGYVGGARLVVFRMIVDVDKVLKYGSQIVSILVRCFACRLF